MIDTVIAETIAHTGAKRDDMIGVGVGAPGPLDRERGIVVLVDAAVTRLANCR